MLLGFFKKKGKGKTFIRTFKDFKAEFEEKGIDPRGTILYYLVAALEYALGNQKDGEAMATLTMPKDFSKEDKKSPSGLKFLRTEKYYLDQIAQNPAIIGSYLGGTPSNGYTIDTNKLTISIIEQEIGEDEAKIIIQSAGKQNPTPIQLKKNVQGIWKIFRGTSSIATGVKMKSDKDF